MLLSSKCRTAAEILLTLAVLAYVTYDLVDLGKKPSQETISLPLQEKSATSSSEALPLSSLSAETSSKSLVTTSRFEALVDPTINSTIYVCGETAATASPQIVGGGVGGTKQAIIFLGNLACASNPTLVGAGNVSYAPIYVRTGSWLSLQNIVCPNNVLTGAAGILSMDAGSYLEAVVPSCFVPNAFLTQVFPLLITQGPCPNTVGVNFVITNCPVDTTLAPVGAYSCYLTSSASSSSCTLSLTIVGALSVQPGVYVQMVLSKDCLTMTQALMKQIIMGVTGIPAASILITYWQCASIVVYLTTLGGTLTSASSALNIVYNSARAGPLNQALGVISVAIVPDPSPASNYTYTTMTLTYPHRYPYSLPILVPYSQSNPGLLALLTLLLIPVMIGLALLFWCACRPRKVVCPPCPCPCPSPCITMPLCAPVCEPVCCPAPMPCEPMCAPMVAPTYQPVTCGTC